MSTKTLLRKLDQMERDLQQLKIAVYLKLPKRARPKRSRYLESAILRNAEQTREDIWQERYAKKMARFSFAQKFVKSLHSHCHTGRMFSAPSER